MLSTKDKERIYEQKTACYKRATANSEATDSIIELLTALCRTGVHTLTASDALTLAKWPNHYTLAHINTALATVGTAFAIDGFRGNARVYRKLVHEPHLAFPNVGRTAPIRAYAFLLVHGATDITIMCEYLGTDRRKTRDTLLKHDTTFTIKGEWVAVLPGALAPVHKKLNSTPMLKGIMP